MTDLGQVDIALAAGGCARNAPDGAPQPDGAARPAETPPTTTWTSRISAAPRAGPCRWIAGGLEVLDARVAQHPYSGLWVGYASVNKVNQPASLATPNAPVGTASDFTFA